MYAVKSSEMGLMDRYMIDEIGVPGIVLMENASKSVVDVILANYPLEKLNDKSVTILCGTGNNGGDGLAISRWLIHKGYQVKTVLVGNVEQLKPDPVIEYKALQSIVNQQNSADFLVMEKNNDGHKELVSRWIEEAGLIIDSLLGTGCDRTLSESYLFLVNCINLSKGQVVSVDIPTGINSDNGKVMGDCVSADHTVTFCAPKLGLLLFPGNKYVGRLTVADIGITSEALQVADNPVTLLDKEYFMELKSRGTFRRSRFSHKGTFGTLGVIAGDKSMLGATILAVKAAYRSGVGLVKVFSEQDTANILIQAVPECVVVSDDHDLESFILSTNAILIGPGLSKSLRAQRMVQKILQLDAKVVMDADALNIVSEHIDWFEDRRCEAVITPHIGEMARLTEYPKEGIEENTLQFAEAFAAKYKVDTVLKSARTVVCTKDGKSYINMLGNSGMATAGSGDVLAGVIGALAAGGMALSIAARAGVMLHSFAGDEYIKNNPEPSLMAGDIISCLWRGL